MTAQPESMNPRHPSNVQNPYPLFSWLREEAPVHWSDSMRSWIVTRYDDVMHVLQEPLVFSADRFRKLGDDFTSQRPAVQAVREVLKQWFVYQDPPDHTRTRALLHNTFTPGRLDRIRPRIQSIVDGLFDTIDDTGEMDFIQNFAFPLPATVISLMMGVPAEDIDDIKIWSDQMNAYIGGDQGGDQDNFAVAGAGVTAMSKYFRNLLEQRKSKPGDDLISLMMAAEEGGSILSDDEIVANCLLLMFAGHETTTNLLGNGLYHLLRHPDQYALLRKNPGLVPSAVEEFLRYDGPVPGIIKVASQDTELNGQTIRKGEMVMIFLSSANRDDRQFPDPDRLDIAREPNRHIAFGYGIHFCLGAPLARLEGQITFDTLMRRYSHLELAEEDLPWHPLIFLRGLKHLPIAFHPANQARAVGE